MKAYTLLIFTVTILFLTSCGLVGTKCKGVHNRITDTAIDMSTVDTVVAQSERYRHNIELAVLKKTEEGDRTGGCLTKEYVVAIDDAIDTTGMKVICDRDLHWYNKFTFPAGTNILNQQVFHPQLYNHSATFDGGTISIDIDSLTTGRYRYFVFCTTRKGKSFSDSIDVYYH